MRRTLAFLSLLLVIDHRRLFVSLVLKGGMLHSLLALRSVVAVGSFTILASGFLFATHPVATHSLVILGGR